MNIHQLYLNTFYPLKFQEPSNAILKYYLTQVPNIPVIKSFDSSSFFKTLLNPKSVILILVLSPEDRTLSAKRTLKNKFKITLMILNPYVLPLDYSYVRNSFQLQYLVISL